MATKNNTETFVLLLLTVLVGAVIWFGILVPAWNHDADRRAEWAATNAVAEYQLEQMQATLDALKAGQATEEPEATGSAEAEVPVSVQEAGTLASDQPTNEDGYQASPIGALGSNLPLLCETWGPTPEGDTGFVVTIPAGSVMWEQNHYGGTCWWVDPADLEAAIQRSVDAITLTNGVAPIVVRLPNDTFPLLGCLQSLPVENGVRHCDPVGGYPGYDSPAENPTPGYFPGYGN